MIDDIDRKILTLLQSNCRVPIAETAEKVGLSLSACHRRIGQLEKAGLIEYYAARLNGTALGYAMTFYLEVSLESQSDAALAEFEAAALASDKVLECHLMTGDADYLLKVASQDTQDYEQLYRRTIAALPHVVKIKSSLVMKTVKRWKGYPPLPVR
ncbi:MAG: Lrp/AsnC family transcriptional regulator [Maricaulaceae bacterium]